MTALEALQRAPLFKDFRAPSLETLAGIAGTRAVPQGTVLFREDDVGESLLVIVAGSVRVTQGPPGAEREVATLGPGEHLGALGLLARSTHLVSAVAATDCEVLELTRREFFRKAQEKPVTCLKLAVVVAGDLARRIEENKEALRRLAATSAR